MAEVVSVSVSERIALVSIDNPPVNALAQNVRAGLKQAFVELRTRPDVKAIVIGCKGRTFVAGADIGEFDSGIAAPGYYEVLGLIEDSACPVVAAVHGTALGGGMEITLASHYRVAHEAARFGLPELTLGIIPGAGGTQRLPRLIPLEAAIDLMLSSKPMPAAQARELGLVDALVAGDVIEGGIAFARDLVARGAGPRRTRDQAVRGAENAAELIAQKRAQVAKTMRNRQSPLALLDALQAAATLPFADGLKAESAISDKLVPATEARALRHLFFAEREVRKIPGLAAGVKARPVARVGIVGAGTMGGGISMCFANAGVPVTLLDAT